MNEVGFPDGQLIAWGMDPETASQLALAFRSGKDMRDSVDHELTPILEDIIERLEQHSQYGKGL